MSLSFSLPFSASLVQTLRQCNYTFIALYDDDYDDGKNDDDGSNKCYKKKTEWWVFLFKKMVQMNIRRKNIRSWMINCCSHEIAAFKVDVAAVEISWLEEKLSSNVKIVQGSYSRDHHL